MAAKVQIPLASWGPKQRYALAVALSVLVSATFGGYAVLTNASLRGSGTSPLVFALLRDTIGAVVLMTAAWATRGRRGGSWTIKAEDTGYFVLLSVLGVYGAQGMSAIALKYTTSAFFGATSAVQPVVALITAMFLGLEPVGCNLSTLLKVAGILTSIAGAALLVVSSSLPGGLAGGSDIAQGATNLPLGAIACVLQIILGGMYLPLQRRMLSRYSPLVVSAHVYALGAALLLLCALVGTDDPSGWSLSPSAFGAVAYAGLLSSALNYFLLSFIVAIASPVLPSAVMAGNCMWTALFAFAFQGARLSGSDVGLCGVIVAGLLLLVAAQTRDGRGEDDGSLRVSLNGQDEEEGQDEQT